jgi:hypothetical protein
MSWLTISRNPAGGLLEVDVAPGRKTSGTDEGANREVVGVPINSKESREASASGGLVLFEKDVSSPSIPPHGHQSEEIRSLPLYSKF